MVVTEVPMCVMLWQRVSFNWAVEEGSVFGCARGCGMC